MRKWTGGLIVGSLMLLDVTSSADSLILQVPDWNQPTPLNYPADNLPPLMGGVDAYPMWCSPTAGGNLMGYWEDVRGAFGLTDRKAFNLTTAYAGTPATWEQGLYHDGIVEMGWWMDTGGWRTMGNPFPSYRQGGTMLAKILPGLITYAVGNWTDNDFPPPVGGGGSGIVKIGFPNTAGFTENVATVALSAMWLSYRNNVDAAQPIEVSFDRWVSADMNADFTLNGQTVHKYFWGNPLSEGHSVVGVGYVDPNPQLMEGNEWFICQDGWGTTPQYVAVPVDAAWVQNDYITNIPEPSSLLLLAGGTGLFLALRRRARNPLNRS